MGLFASTRFIGRDRNNFSHILTFLAAAFAAARFRLSRLRANRVAMRCDLCRGMVQACVAVWGRLAATRRAETPFVTADFSARAVEQTAETASPPARRRA